MTIKERPLGESLEYRFYNLLRHPSSSQPALDSMLRELIDDRFDIHNLYNHYTTAIHVASEFGNLDLVAALLRLGAASDILRGDRSDSDTALHIAAIGGSLPVFEALLEALGATIPSPNLGNRHGMTPLHYALGKGNVAMAELLVRRGADLQQADLTGAQALHFAARSGSIQALEFVFERLPTSRDVNRATRSGLTALHYASWNGKLRAMEWLLEKGSLLRVRDNVEGGTALHWAALRGDKGAVRILVEACVRKGLRVFAENRSGKSVLELAEEHGRDHVRDLLRVVVDQGLLDRRAFPQISLVRYVIGYGDSNTIERLERSLEYAIEKKRQVYSTNLETLLVESDFVDWAAKRGNKESVNLLMKLLRRYIANGHLLEKKMASVLHNALSFRKLEFAASLADHKYYKENMTEVLRSMKDFLKKEAESLISELKGTDVRRFSSVEKLREDIPLAFWIFYEDRQDISKFIYSRGVWRDIVNERGIHSQRTAMHWATLLGKNEVVTRLCEIPDCKANLEDKHGKPPYRYAVEHQQNDIRKELSGREDVRAYLDILYRDRQVFVDALNAILVGAALIASISFQGFLQPPGGLDEKLRVVDTHKAGIKLFLWFNSLSFFFAMASALAAARGVLPMPDIYIQQVVKRIERVLFAAGLTLAISISFGLLAFAAAGFSVLPPTLDEQSDLIGTSAVGGIICLGMLVWFLRGLFMLFKRYFLAPKTLLVPPHSFSASSVLNPVVHIDNVNEQKPSKGEFGDPDEHRFKYEVGANYFEYPWQDGLDKLCEESVLTVE